ncbi:hypothetical protein FRC10_003583, partial [Ceratobasidium sp. 414]
MAVLWVKELHGTAHAKIQGGSLFAQEGQLLRTELFSKHLQELTKAGMGVSLKIPEFHHTMIAVMHRIVENGDWVSKRKPTLSMTNDWSEYAAEVEDEELYDEDEDLPEQEMDQDLINVLELQAGHSVPTAHQDYAVLTAQEWHMLLDDTVQKWIQASCQMFTWLLKSPLSNSMRSTLTEADPDDYIPESPV